MTTKAHTADPTSCLVCARMRQKYGPKEKCRRHGGKSHTTAYRGKGPKSTVAAPVIQGVDSFTPR